MTGVVETGAPVDAIKGDLSFEEALVTDLVKVLERDGRFMHPISVAARTGEGLVIIAGRNRLEAWRRHFGPKANIPVNIYEGLSPAQATILEIEENLRRKTLTPEEREQATVRLVEAINEVDAGNSGNQVPEKAKRGRKQGAVSKAAKTLGVSKRAVNKTLAKARARKEPPAERPRVEVLPPLSASAFQTAWQSVVALGPNGMEKMLHKLIEFTEQDRRVETIKTMIIALPSEERRELFAWFAKRWPDEISVVRG